MEKQRATEILMEALCLSVPNDPAFVLEVHKDVLKSRLRYVRFVCTFTNMARAACVLINSSAHLALFPEINHTRIRRSVYSP